MFDQSKKKPGIDLLVLDGLMGKGGHDAPDQGGARDPSDAEEEAEGENPGDSADPSAKLDQMQELLDQLKASLVR